ncbi:hypothetical protein QAD02_000456 [Eretmocerus hayati]|uniref:Uncharacterized protein n=1 Tax=Eretmocerus hayati TaxID=131215 RepID=A0ACC2NDG1_9HYME|nr:hypothetical protein QAD02_000456 [Eretmocerus hayati]
MIEGDILYSLIRNLSRLSNFPIDQSGFLHVRNLDTIRESFIMYDHDFSIQYQEDTDLFGSLCDGLNDGQVGKTLAQSLHLMFETYTCGILMVHNSSFGIIYCNRFYFITDSHSCDSRGLSTHDGRSCIIQCKTFQDLINVCRIKFGTGNVVYNLHCVEVGTEYDPVLDEIILSREYTDK